MSVPDFQTLMLPILELFAQGKSSVKECLDPLRIQFNISDEAAAETLESGQTALYIRAHWARTYLGKAGLLESKKRGFHEITEKGRQVLASAPKRIDIKFLREFDQFKEWTSDAAKTESEVLEADATTISDRTPEDIIQSAHRMIESALADEILSAMVQMPPAKFEVLILDLLQAMGFGRGRSEYKRLTPFTGDGGIDGVISEDPLGLDAVYIQAKRYSAENKISRPDIQRFVGSLTGESATKGVFVTTSDFSRDAVAYIERVQQRVPARPFTTG